MTEREVLKHIDDGANYYVSLFGKAEHMEIIEKEFYSYVKPKGDCYGISIIYNVRLEHLPVKKQKELIVEMKALHMPIWLNLLTSDEVFFLLFGKEKIHGQTIFAENDEIYLALLPDEKEDYFVSNEKIVKVQSAEEFAIWAKIANDVLADGRLDMHPVKHFPLCQKGMIKCYILYSDNVPVAVASVIDNDGVASLEFVATIPQMRRQGFAQAVCEKAVYDAFADGAKIVTVRAIDAVAAKLYQSVGFKVYNYAI